MIYGFAFTRRNISCSTLYTLPDIDHRYLLWGEESIDRYCKLLVEQQPQFILGLGIYTRPCKNLLRIEKICNNRFGKNKLNEGEYREQPIRSFLEPGEQSTVSTSIGNSYCNLVSWKISGLISSGELAAQYTFVHIPKRMKCDEAASELESMLDRAALI